MLLESAEVSLKSSEKLVTELIGKKPLPLENEARNVAEDPLLMLIDMIKCLSLQINSINDFSRSLNNSFQPRI